MAFFSHRVERSDLEAGDHIYTWRTPVFAYSHHGIYVGGDIVVHFTQDQNQSEGNIGFSSSVPDVAEPCSAFRDHRFRKHTSGVVISCLNCFLGNGSLYRFQYGVGGATLVAKLQSGICTTVKSAKSDPPKDVIHRAMYLLQNGFGKYNMFSLNCEDFALYCKTGLVVCSGKTSGLSGQASSFANASAATILSLPRKIFVSNPLVLGATALGNYSLNRYFSDCGVRRDVKKVAVEDFAAFHADLPAEKDPHDDGAKKVITENSMIVDCGYRTGEINVVPCNKYVDCGYRTGRLGFQEQPQVCQWFQEPCKGRVKEILSDLRNRSLEGKHKSVGKDYAELVDRWNDYKNACEREMKTLKQDCEREMKTLKQDCEREMKTLKQELDGLKFKLHAVDMMGMVNDLIHDHEKEAVAHQNEDEYVNLEDEVDEVPTPTAEDSVGQSNFGDVRPPKNHEKRKVEESIDVLVELIGDIQKNSSAKYQLFSSSLGYQANIEKGKSEMFELLQNIPSLSLDEVFEVGEKLLQKPEKLEFFILMPEAARPAYVTKLMMGDK